MTGRILLALLAIASALQADNWGECHKGPFRVFTSAGDKPARAKLAELEQLRHAVGITIGMPEIQPIWPVHVVVSQRDAPMTRFVLGRNSYEIALAPGAPVPDEVKANLTRILLDEGTLHIPTDIENGLVALFSTLQVSGVHVTVGAPPPNRSRDWARVQMLVTNPETYGEVHVFFSNLERGAPLDIAYQNAFQKGAAEIEKQVDQYLRAGNFQTNSINAEPISEERDLRVHPLVKSDADLAQADLLLATNPPAAADLYRSAQNLDGKEGLGFVALAAKRDDEARKLLGEAAQAGSKNARVWYELGLLEPDAKQKRIDLDKAAQLNGRWSAPFLALADTEPVPVRRAFWLKKACQADPRSTDCWVRLAHADEEAHHFDEAVKAWVTAENSVSDEARREELHQKALASEAERTDFEVAERKKEDEERQADLDRVKNATLAEIHAAEAQANAKLGDESAEGAVSWSDLTRGDATAEGTLNSVECVGRQTRLVVQTSDGPVRIAADLDRIAFEGRVTATKLACGAQDPARKVIVHYNRGSGKRAAGVSGQAVAIDFR